MGKVLQIDLSKMESTVQELTENLAKNYIGGRGFALRILFDEVKPNIDAFSPENILLFITGPLTGTLAPQSGRFTVAGKSPLSGIYGDANSGGH